MTNPWKSLTAVAVLGSVAAAQATLLVPSQYATIQAAIAAAQTSDTVLVGPGTWFEHLDTLGKTLTLRGDQGAAATLIDGGGTDRPLVIAGGAPVVEGLTLTHGTAPVVAGNQQYGGAVSISGGTPVFRDCIVSQNTLTSWNASGGGVYAQNSSPQFERCSFANNQCVGPASKTGGAVVLSGTVGASFRECSFTGNLVDSWFGPSSGAVFVNSDSLFDSCVFRNNQVLGTGVGGAVGCTSASVFRGCLFDSNVAGRAGAVWISSSTLATSPVSALFTNCTFSANQSTQSGGAVHCDVDWTHPRFEACTFVGNSGSFNAYPGGSALVNLGATISISSCVFAGNTGLAVVNQASDTGSMAIRNCTFVANSGGPAVQSHFAQFVIVPPTLVTNSAFWQNTGDFGLNVVPASCLTGIDPLFANAAAGDYHLLPGSPAIDAGIAVPVATDFEGDPRHFGAAFDIGADEHRIGAQLVLDQPSGPGSARIRVLAAPPGFGAFTPISFYAQAAGSGADTRWAGLWARFSELLDQAILGVPPFVMPLDAAGTATWQVPAGSLPPSLAGFAVHAVSTTFDPSVPAWGPASPVAHLVLQ